MVIRPAYKNYCSAKKIALLVNGNRNRWRLDAPIFFAPNCLPSKVVSGQRRAVKTLDHVGTWSRKQRIGSEMRVEASKGCSPD